MTTKISVLFRKNRFEPFSPGKFKLGIDFTKILTCALFVFFVFTLFSVQGVHASGPYGAESNPTGNPVGGGDGYTKLISKTDSHIKATVSTRDQLLTALKSARSGDIIYIAGSANIDLSGVFNTVIPGGVTLASNRGDSGAQGGRIFQEKKTGDPSSGRNYIFKTGGENVRLTGIRLDGPFHTTSSAPDRGGIYTSYRGLQVDNCELYGFSYAAISLSGITSSRVYIHHNYIHHNQRDGLGYGVVIVRSDALIEANIFDYNRHAVAASGHAGEGYEARYNLALEHANGHVFDMHPDPDGSGYAGTWMKIHHNTIKVTDRYGVFVRGKPRDSVTIDHNWFLRSEHVILQTGTSVTRVYATDNAIGSSKTVRATGPVDLT